jgi:hypothetical protein
MHIDDEPSFLAGNGLPYEFASGEESGLVEANVSSPTAVSFGPIGAQHPFTDDYPAANALVTFRQGPPMRGARLLPTRRPFWLKAEAETICFIKPELVL